MPVLEMNDLHITHTGVTLNKCCPPSDPNSPFIKRRGQNQNPIFKTRTQEFVSKIHLLSKLVRIAKTL